MDAFGDYYLVNYGHQTSVDHTWMCYHVEPLCFVGNLRQATATVVIVEVSSGTAARSSTDAQIASPMYEDAESKPTFNISTLTSSSGRDIMRPGVDEPGIRSDTAAQ